MGSKQPSSFRGNFDSCSSGTILLAVKHKDGVTFAADSRATYKYKTEDGKSRLGVDAEPAEKIFPINKCAMMLLSGKADDCELLKKEVRTSIDSKEVLSVKRVADLVLHLTLANKDLSQLRVIVGGCSGHESFIYLISEEKSKILQHFAFEGSGAKHVVQLFEEKMALFRPDEEITQETARELIDAAFMRACLHTVTCGGEKIVKQVLKADSLGEEDWRGPRDFE